MFDLAIVGGGPAGAAAAVYASRKRLKTALVTDTFGGQSTVSEDVQNWIGTPHITGTTLGEALKAHVMAYAADSVTVREGELVNRVERTDSGFRLTTSESTLNARAVLVAAGSHRRKLTVPGADAYENKGITYCASCDGPLFADKDVAVIGGGNAAFETVAQLVAYAKHVTLLNRSDLYRADPVTVDKVLSHPNMTAIKNADLVRIEGERFVTSLTYKDVASGAETKLPVEGVFVEIGLMPTTGLVEGLVELDEYKRIVIDPWTQATSIPGIWAAGDCTNVRYHQNNIAAGDAVRALEDIYLHLNAK